MLKAAVSRLEKLSSETTVRDEASHCPAYSVTQGKGEQEGTGRENRRTSLTEVYSSDKSSPAVKYAMLGRPKNAQLGPSHRAALFAPSPPSPPDCTLGGGGGGEEEGALSFVPSLEAKLAYAAAAGAARGGAEELRDVLRRAEESGRPSKVLTMLRAKAAQVGLGSVGGGGGKPS